MIKRLILTGQTKEKYPIRVHAIRNNGGYAIFLAVKTEYAEYTDTAYGNVVDQDLIDDPDFWRGYLEESMKVICSYYLTDSYKFLNSPQEEYYAARDAAVEYNMKRFPSRKFQEDCWQTVGWYDPGYC